MFYFLNSFFFVLKCDPLDVFYFKLTRVKKKKLFSNVFCNRFRIWFAINKIKRKIKLLFEEKQNLFTIFELLLLFFYVIVTVFGEVLDVDEKPVVDETVVVLFTILITTLLLSSTNSSIRPNNTDDTHNVAIHTIITPHSTRPCANVKPACTAVFSSDLFCIIIRDRKISLRNLFFILSNFFKQEKKNLCNLMLKSSIYIQWKNISIKTLK